MSPGLLLLDEPLSALDAKVRVHLRHEVKDLQRKLGITTVMVTHDQEEALSMADRIVVMNHGVIEQIGSPTEIYREPETLFVADFIGEMNQIPAVTQAGADTGPKFVKISDLTVQCSDHGFAADQLVIAAVRPEDIIPHGPGARSEGAPDMISEPDNALDVQISEMEFLGSYWRARLTGSNMGGAELIADFSINAVRRMDMAEGKNLVIEIPSKRLKIFEKPVDAE